MNYQALEVSRNMNARFLPILLLLIFTAGCGDSDAEVSLKVLADYQQGYDGRTVVTEGKVRTFDDPRHYWIEDDDLNRVAITPDDAVAEHVGQSVRVTGVFSASREAGRSIEATRVSPIAE